MWNLSKFQVIQTIVIFSIDCLIELKFCEVSQNPKSWKCWKFQLSILTSKKVLFLKKIRVSEGINLKFVLIKFWVGFLKHRVSEIRVKRIRVNRGVSVYTAVNWNTGNRNWGNQGIPVLWMGMWSHLRLWSDSGSNVSMNYLFPRCLVPNGSKKKLERKITIHLKAIASSLGTKTNWNRLFNSLEIELSNGPLLK